MHDSGQSVKWSLIDIQRSIGKVPAGFIVTGPNIASQGLLFEQLTTRLSNEFNGPVVTLRSGESSNLKALLKKLIRDVTHQKSNGEDENDNFLEQDVSQIFPNLHLIYSC